MFPSSQLIFYVILQALTIRCWSPANPFTVNYAAVDGIDLFYREAGQSDHPLILLLHGSPDSSFYYRHLLPYLADAGYHVLAPDYPGFGFTQVPTQRNYTYTFASISSTLDLWLTSNNIKTFSMYLFDFGTPVGFNLALSGKYNITAIVDQNGGAYADGFGPDIQPFIDYGEDPNSQTNLQTILDYMTPAAVRELYSVGVPDNVTIEPESYTLDSALLAIPYHLAAELSLWRDWSASVVPAYTIWQEWLRQNQPPLLAIWGANDPAQLPAGAYAFRRDVPDAEVILVDAGHFVLETNAEEVASAMVAFFKSRGI